MNNFERWAKSKGMLIDKDKSGKYKSLETRAYAETWKDATRELLESIEQVLEHCVLVQKIWGDGWINTTPIIDRLEKAIANAK